jgi:phenylacetaldehyde dehydrogenase
VTIHELPTQRDLIAGEWSEPTVVRSLDGEPRWIEHASTGERVQHQLATDEAGVERAIVAASELHLSGDWQATTAEGRADHLDAMANELERLVPEVAANESATTGAILPVTTMLGFILHGAFRLAAMQLRSGLLSRRMEGPAGLDIEVDRLGWGPALLLCPWNAPAPMAAHKAASALAAGCPVLIKPPELAPHGSESIGAAAMAAGLPPGLVQILHGGPEVAGALLNDTRVRAVSFTGGIVGGRAVAHACAEGLKPAQLELGGHSPLIVLDDADPAIVAEAVVGLLTMLNGQWCRALGRLLLPASRATEYLDATLAALSAVQIGDPFAADVAMGPIVSSEHLAHLQGRVAQFASAGARVFAPATLPDAPGNWMSPTLVDGIDPANSAEEMFGPMAAVHTYSTLDDAVALANGTEYGLEAYVVGADVEAAMRVARRVRAGGVKVNGVSPMSLNLMAPRPAFGISGIAEEGTAETILFFAGNRVVGVEGSLGATY